MNKKNRSFSVVAVAILPVFLVACSSTTMIRSNVPGADVYVDGTYRGKAPVAMTDTKITGSSTQIRIEAPGYEPLHAVISRNEQFSVGACIGGVFLLVPFLWIMEYQADHFYTLRPAGAAPAYPQPNYPQRPQQPPAQPNYPQQPAPQPAPGGYPPQ